LVEINYEIIAAFLIANFANSKSSFIPVDLLVFMNLDIYVFYYFKLLTLNLVLLHQYLLGVILLLQFIDLIV